MKKSLFMLAAMIPALTWAGVTAVSLSSDTSSTDSTAVTDTKYNITGQVLEITVYTSGTTDVQVATTSGVGSSLAAAKTLFTMATVTGSSTTYPGTNAVPVYLYNDTVSMSATGATEATDNIQVIILLDTK